MQSTSVKEYWDITSTTCQRIHFKNRVEKICELIANSALSNCISVESIYHTKLFSFFEWSKSGLLERYFKHEAAFNLTELTPSVFSVLWEKNGHLTTKKQNELRIAIYHVDNLWVYFRSRYWMLTCHKVLTAHCQQWFIQKTLHDRWYKKKIFRINNAAVFFLSSHH